ncbi:MAG: hypothetical protein ACREVK_00045 [Gammaproteobacteria bacterium]
MNWIEYLSATDPTTRRLLEGILAVEEEHADDLVNLPERLER